MINSATDKITSDKDYITAVQKFGKEMATNMAASSFFEVNPNILANPDLAIRGADAYSSVASKYDKPTYELGYNSMTGGSEAGIMENLFGGISAGGNKFSGIAGPAINAYSAISTAMLGRDSLEATKENNAAKLKLIEEDNRRKAIDQKNKIHQARRYAGFGMGNSNNQGATMATVNRNPYSIY